MVLRLFVGGAGALDTHGWGLMLASQASGVTTIDALIDASQIEGIHPSLQRYAEESGPLIVQLPDQPLDAVRKLKAAKVDVSDGSHDVALIGYESLSATISGFLVAGRYNSSCVPAWVDRTEALLFELERSPGVFLVSNEASSARPDQLMAALSLRFDLKLDAQGFSALAQPGHRTLARLLSPQASASPDSERLEQRLAARALVAPPPRDGSGEALGALSEWFASLLSERERLRAAVKAARDEVERLSVVASQSGDGAARADGGDEGDVALQHAPSVRSAAIVDSESDLAQESAGAHGRAGAATRPFVKRMVAHAYQMSPSVLKSSLRRVTSGFKLRREMKIIEESDLFDAVWYASRYRDISEVEALRHFATHGWKESRAPGPLFCCSQYVERYPDIAESEMNPLVHYEVTGRSEGRHAFPVHETEVR